MIVSLGGGAFEQLIDAPCPFGVPISALPVGRPCPVESSARLGGGLALVDELKESVSFHRAAKCSAVERPLGPM